MPRSTSDPAPRLVKTALGAIGVAEEGDPSAPPMLCLHGLPGSSRDFRYLGPLLAERFRVLRLEMPGFGIAPRGRMRTLADWARAVTVIANALDLPRVNLLAHSFGGGAAALAAADADGSVGSLVLIASMGARIHRAFARPPRSYGRLRDLVLFPPTRPITVALARRSYARLRLPQPDGWRDFCLHLGLMASVDFAAIGRAARATAAPTLVFHAEDDPLVEPQIAEEMVELLPAARLIRFPGGGHHLQKTRAQEIAAAMIEEMVRSPSVAATAGTPSG